MYYTELNNRTLYFDGKSVFNADHILQLQRKYNIKYVNKINNLVTQYNKLTTIDKNIVVKDTCDKLNKSWNLPEYYKKLDVIQYVFDKHIEITANMSDEEINNRDKRLVLELNKYKSNNKINLLRTIIYITEELNNQDIVYGVGRGSSVSSYVLFVIGIHDVDSFLYDLDIDDFFHE